MRFSDALTLIEDGHCLRRTGWNGPDQWIKGQFPDQNSMMSEPYIYIRNQQGGFVPWLASQGDIFAKDWELVP